MGEKKECLFCKIANKEAGNGSGFVYENDSIVVFLDISPSARGHVLVAPKKHFVNILDLPDTLLTEMMFIVKKVGFALSKALGATGFNLIVNNFENAGQLIMHAHFHVIPRYDEKWDGNVTKYNYKEGEKEEVQKKLLNVLKG